jgi:hypothetical protein
MNSRLVDLLATTAARIEEAAYPNAVILPNFPRSIQLDYHTCGSKSVYVILRYYNKRCTPNSVERGLMTVEDGTSVADIKRVLKERKLSFRELHSEGIVDLKKAIGSGGGHA